MTVVFHHLGLPSHNLWIIQGQPKVQFTHPGKGILVPLATFYKEYLHHMEVSVSLRTAVRLRPRIQRDRPHMDLITG